MMRVLLLSADIDRRAGWGNFTDEFCRALSRRNDIAFELCLPHDAEVTEAVSYASHIQRCLPSWRGTFQRAWHRAVPFIWPPRVAHDADLIHSLVEFPFAILARGLARRAAIPYGITTQGTYGVVPFTRLPDRWLFQRALGDAAFVTAPSRFTADKVREGRTGLRVHVIHNGVNFGRLQQQVDQEAVRRRFRLPSRGRLVLGVGVLKRRKGFDVLIRACKLVFERIPDAHLIIAGRGGWDSVLRTLAADLHIASRVHLVGSVDDSELTGLYQICDVFAHLPVNVQGNFEGFGMVLLEAGACEKPVVASRSGGVADAVVDGKTGLLVEEGNHEAAGAAIARLLEDSSLARTLGAAGREYAREHDWALCVDRWVELYQSVRRTR